MPPTSRTRPHALPVREARARARARESADYPLSYITLLIPLTSYFRTRSSVPLDRRITRRAPGRPIRVCPSFRRFRPSPFGAPRPPSYLPDLVHMARGIAADPLGRRRGTAVARFPAPTEPAAEERSFAARRHSCADRDRERGTSGIYPPLPRLRKACAAKSPRDIYRGKVTRPRCAAPGVPRWCRRGSPRG